APLEKPRSREIGNDRPALEAFDRFVDELTMTLRLSDVPERARELEARMRRDLVRALGVEPADRLLVQRQALVHEARLLHRGRETSEDGGAERLVRARDVERSAIQPFGRVDVEVDRAVGGHAQEL